MVPLGEKKESSDENSTLLKNFSHFILVYLKNDLFMVLLWKRRTVLFTTSIIPNMVPLWDKKGSSDENSTLLKNFSHFILLYLKNDLFIALLWNN